MLTNLPYCPPAICCWALCPETSFLGASGDIDDLGWDDNDN